MTNIEYSEALTNQNKNLVFFISKTSELYNISLPSNVEFNLKNKLLLRNIENKKKIILDLYNNITNFRVLIILINPKETKPLTLGASISANFEFKFTDNLSFFFSKFLLQKHHKLVSDIVLGFQIKLYKYDKFKKIDKNIPNKLNLNITNNKIIKIINYNTNLVKSINTSKELVSEPANILNPITYSNRCKDLKIKGLKVKELDLVTLNKIGMNSLLAVSKGSVNEPRVIVMEWNLKKNKKPIILVGKGVTFDSGGISLKPSSGMEEMITDMGGSAVVVGSMINAALNKSNKSIVGIIGLVENMPDGKAQRPGDIIKSLSGQTIEVLNTDAEGRLVLADLITYVQQKYKPLEIIDFATLTGAIMIALGTHKAGIFSNNDKLAKNLFISGEETNENIWRLPLGEEYGREINSSRADIKNIGSSRYGGSIHAAEFIKKFVNNNIPWAHIDIAGVSWTMKGGQNNITSLHNPGATAFGVRLIDNYLKGKK